MKAVVYREYGSPDVLHVDEIEQPEPKENEVLVRVHATPVNYGDLLARNLKDVTGREFNMPLPLLLPTRLFFGWSKPKVNVLGSEFAGEVESVGTAVSKFKKGDQIYGYLGQPMGAYAEYVCMPEDGTLAIMPENMRYEEASAVPYGAIMAVSLLERGNIQPGQKVLINGASGGIGSAAVQLAKYYGAEVTGVCGTQRMAYVKALGADHVIDYKQEDFTQNGETYDLIFDILGKSSFSKCKPSLTENGIYLLASFKVKPILQMIWTSIFGSKKVVCAMASEEAKNLDFVRALIEAGSYQAIIDKCFSMEQAAQAHQYAESGEKKGNIIIVMA